MPIREIASMRGSEGVEIAASYGLAAQVSNRQSWQSEEWPLTFLAPGNGRFSGK
jgi:hypothetical protein